MDVTFTHPTRSDAMAMNYDLMLSDAKRHVTETLIRSQRDENANLSDLASAIDGLNSAWDKLTDALVRQRDELEKQVLSLIRDLAEAKKRV